MNEILCTQELLETLNACEESKVFLTQNNLWNQPESVVVQACTSAGVTQFNEWWLKKKQTEEFVRYNGKVITMEEFKVFNPLTGQHSTFLTEEEARIALIEIAKQILSQHCPRVVRALRNENGDETWVPTELHCTLNIV